MKKMLIAGVFREEIYSPNAVEPDRGIMEESLRCLEFKLGDTAEVVRLYADRDNLKEAFEVRKPTAVLSMAQGPAALAALRTLERARVKVWNPTGAIKACYREELSVRLGAADVGYPTYMMTSTAKPVDPSLFKCNRGYWLKRGDVHAVTPEDVSYAPKAADINRLMKAFEARGVSKVIIQEHVEGQVVKFYGIRNGFFDYKLVPTGFKEAIPVNLALIRDTAAEAAEILGLEVYGGDCVVDRRGGVHVIDMNDWPSFRSCRMTAARAIADHAIVKLLKIRNVELWDIPELADEVVVANADALTPSVLTS